MQPPRLIIDLTQRIGIGTVMWPGTQAPVFSVTESYATHGSFSRTMTLHEHTGTHVDAPAHFIEGGATVDQLPPERLVCPLAIIDVRSQSSANADYVLTITDIGRNEELYGEIPTGGVVAICTGWSTRSANERSYLGLNNEGALRFPGFGQEAAEWLVQHRRVTGLGIDTAGVDAGHRTDFVVHSRATLPKGVWHLEGLINLEQVPPRGALIFVGVLPLAGGSGAPARVLAVL